MPCAKALVRHEKNGKNQSALDEDNERKSEQRCADAIEDEHGSGDSGFHGAM
jgi:hypothetical protein